MNHTVDKRIERLLEYWFGNAADPDAGISGLMRKWFMGGRNQDRELEALFARDVRAAAAGELDEWAGTPRGRLALILLHDQLPRSLFRGTPEAFAQDSKALEFCLEGLARGDDQALEPLQRIFLMMPLQHAESRNIQLSSVAAFEALAATDTTKEIARALRHSADYAIEHKSIIDRFGRFPHRNEILGRESTPAEIAFLAAGGARFGQ